MGSKRHDAKKISVYVDHSTLCAAFKAHRAQPDAADYAAYLPLRAWLGRVAEEGNLCLSTTHIVELFRWDDAATADEMARWYDALPIVWTGSVFDDVQNFEGERWTKIAAGVEVGLDGRPFAPSLLAAFHALTPDAAAVLLGEREQALALVKTMRGSAVWRRRYEAYGEAFLSMLVEVVQNHAHPDFRGWTDARKREETARNARAVLRSLARETDTRLTAEGDPGYLRKTCTRDEVQDLFIALFEREPRAMPLFRVQHRFNEGAIARMEGRQVVNGQPSNRLRQALLSSFGDWMHLVGAAYCDMFTCDGSVSKWLGDIRATFGFRPQLAVRGHPRGPAGFVGELMATLS